MLRLGGSTEKPLALHTRLGEQIGNFYCSDNPIAGDKMAVQDYMRSYKGVKHRPVGPSPAYNCHGLTFAARRTGIPLSADVFKIISHDKYRTLANAERIWPGDIAIYVEQREITHSGLVMWIDKDGFPWILSKWGRLHEAIHRPMDCPYNTGVVSYYRLDR